MTWLGLDGNNEHGGKGASLSVHGNDATVFSVSRALSTKAKFKLLAPTFAGGAGLSGAG